MKVLNKNAYLSEDVIIARFGKGEKEMVPELLRNLGHTFKIAEDKLESYAIVSAMLLTRFWFQWNYL